MGRRRPPAQRAAPALLFLLQLAVPTRGWDPAAFHTLATSSLAPRSVLVAVAEERPCEGEGDAALSRCQCRAVVLSRAARVAAAYASAHGWQLLLLPAPPPAPPRAPPPAPGGGASGDAEVTPTPILLEGLAAALDTPAGRDADWLLVLPAAALVVGGGFVPPFDEYDRAGASLVLADTGHCGGGGGGDAALLLRAGDWAANVTASAAAAAAAAAEAAGGADLLLRAADAAGPAPRARVAFERRFTLGGSCPPPPGALPFVSSAACAAPCSGGVGDGGGGDACRDVLPPGTLAAAERDAAAQGAPRGAPAAAEGHRWASCAMSDGPCLRRRRSSRRPPAPPAVVAFYGGDVALTTASHAYPLVLAAGEPGAEACGRDLTAFREVYDFSCSFVWLPGFFHQLMNCLLPLVPLALRAERSRHAAVLAPPVLLELLGALFRLPPPGTTAAAAVAAVPFGGARGGARPRRPGAPGAACAAVAAPSAALVGEMEEDQWQEIFVARFDAGGGGGGGGDPPPLAGPGGPAANARELAGRAAALSAARAGELPGWGGGGGGGANDAAQPRSRLPLLLVVLRDAARGRAWCNPGEVVAQAAAAWPRLRPTVHNASFSLLDGVALFARAAVVVLYHGAAGGHRLFMQPGSALYEFVLSRGGSGAGPGRPYRTLCLSRSLTPDVACVTTALEAGDALTTAEAARLEAMRGGGGGGGGGGDGWTGAMEAWVHERPCLTLPPGAIARAAAAQPGPV